MHPPKQSEHGESKYNTKTLFPKKYFFLKVYFMTTTIRTEINCPNLKLLRQGKVRNVYDLGDELLLVSTDRLSAFDVILNEGIPEKGRILNQLSAHWFRQFSDIPTHFISDNINDFPEITQPYHDQLQNRSMLVKKTERLPVECVVRGYLVGSGWKDYQKTGHVCGIKLPENLQLASKFNAPIFTPAHKVDDGHDENISFDTMVDLVGSDIANQLKTISLSLYERAAKIVAQKGFILADTKFEFGLLNGQVTLIDEIFTPDSSRYWQASDYQLGIDPPSYDKQIIRNYLESSGWDKTPPAPALTNAVIEKLQHQYQTLFNKMTSTNA